MSLSEKINKNSKIILGIILLLVLSGGIFEVARKTEIKDLSTIFCIISVVYLFILLGALFFNKKKKDHIERYLLFCMIFLGIIYCLVFLPGTVPDETTHYICAYNWSNLFSFNKLDTIRVTDLEMIRKGMDHSLNLGHYDRIIHNFAGATVDRSVVEWPNGLMKASLFITNSPLGYVASGFGIAIGRLLSLNGLYTFYLGRLFNILLFSCIVYFAIKKAPYGKMAFFAIATLPMTLHIVASFSYDYLSISCAIFFISQMIAMRESEKPIKKSEMILCCLIGIILSVSKVVYSVLLLLILLVPKKKFISHKQSVIFKLTVISSGFFIILLINVIFSLLGTNGITNVVKEVNVNYYSLDWIIRNPKESVIIVLRTITNYTDFYILSMFGANLGWFEINIPFVCYGFFGLILLSSFMRRENEMFDSFSFIEKIGMMIPAILCIGGIFLALWISYTPFGNGSIYGVQGRYFIPVLPIVFLVLRNNNILIHSKLNETIIWLSLYWHLVTLIEVFVIAT